MTPEQQALADKLTNLQRGVVLGVVAGKTQRQAYYDAGGKAKTDASADAVVSEMLSDPKVRAFYDAMISDAAQEAQITLKTLLEELEEARQVAMHQEKPQAGAMVAASMGKAKLLGLESPQKIDHTSSDKSMTPLDVSKLSTGALAEILSLKNADNTR